ncbi:peptide ABC transporter substrate-binding protein [Tabrizicola sp.]|uniref:peptide ABC transporter substrate-binding protein n=1 Tax=Tabrizicola sp. TaxID=2005166 RepID=UPI003F2EDFD7
MTIRTVLAATVALYALTAGLGLAEAVHPTTGEKLSDNQTYTYRDLDNIITLDPQLVEDNAGHDVARNLFEGLMNQDEKGGLVPGVAESFTVSEDNKTYTFILRKDAKWSNGDPIVAGDFVYAWQRAADPALASNYAWYLELATIKNAKAIVAGEMPADQLGVKAVDDYTLEVQLDEPTPFFAEMTTFATLFPAHKATIEKFGADWTKAGNIVSNGAYTLKELVPNERLVMVRNPMYWDNANTILETITTLVINDENLALTRYQAGELDKTDIPIGQYPDLEASNPDEATSVPNLCTYYYTVNLSDTGNPALKDVRVRQALAYALDRDVIVSSVLKGGQYPAYNLTHQYTNGFEMPAIDYAGWSQADRDAKALELMTAAGFGPDKPLDLTLIYNTSDAHKALATVASQMWKQKLGVNVTLANYEWKTYLEIRAQQQFDLARYAWCGDYNEASTFLNIMTTGNEANDGKFTSAEYDALMAEAKTLADPTPNYTKAEQILAAEMPILPLYQYTSNFMLRADIKGYPYDNVQNNWYGKDMYRVAE